MIVLSAIGRFIKKIWDWIRQTAWIQPLLIVGVIFGVIFSIPSIVNAAKNNKKEKGTYVAWYHPYKLTLDGEKDSEADKFTYALEKAIDGDSTDFDRDYSKYGNKFFIAIVEKSCQNCDEAREGFATFEKKFNQTDAYKVADSNEKFQLVTIFADDENKDTDPDKKTTAFGKYLERHQGFFEDAGSVAYVTDYYYNGKLSESALEGLETADETNFYTPTILLVELGNKAVESKNAPGVTEVMFGIEGSDKNAKAKTLFDCWTHDGYFSSKPKTTN